MPTPARAEDGAPEICAEVHLWQGDQDNRVPPHHAEYLAQAIPRTGASIPMQDHDLLGELGVRPPPAATVRNRRCG